MNIEIRNHKYYLESGHGAGSDEGCLVVQIL